MRKLNPHELHASWPDVAIPTINRWRQQGMPATKHDDGTYRYDLAACAKWRAENKGASTSGGRKAGCGRKPKGEKMPEPEADAPDATGILERIAGMDHDEIVALAAASPDISGFTAVQATRLSQLLKAQREAMEIAERRGELVEIEQVRRGLVIALGRANLIVRGFENTLADSVLAAGGVEGEERAVAVRAVIVQNVDRVVEALGAVTAE